MAAAGDVNGKQGVRQRRARGGAWPHRRSVRIARWRQLTATPQPPQPPQPSSYQHRCLVRHTAHRGARLCAGRAAAPLAPLAPLTCLGQAGDQAKQLASWRVQPGLLLLHKVYSGQWMQSCSGVLYLQYPIHKPQLTLAAVPPALQAPRLRSPAAGRRPLLRSMALRRLCSRTGRQLQRLRPPLAVELRCPQALHPLRVLVEFQLPKLLQQLRAAVLWQAQPAGMAGRGRSSSGGRRARPRAQGRPQMLPAAAGQQTTGRARDPPVAGIRHCTASSKRSAPHRAHNP